MVNELAITWTDGESLSDQTVDCSDIDKLIAVYTKLGFSTTEITAQAILSEGETAMIRNVDGTEWTLTITTTKNEFFAVDPTTFAGVSKFKLRRGTQAIPVTSGTETAVKILRRVY